MMNKFSPIIQEKVDKNKIAFRIRHQFRGNSNNIVNLGMAKLIIAPKSLHLLTLQTILNPNI